MKLGMCNMREMSGRIARPVVGPHAGGHIVERYLDVARAIGCRVQEVRFPVEVPETEAAKAEAMMEHEGARMENPYVVFAVGANWPNKRWPTRYFAQLSDWLYDIQAIPVIVGGGAVDAQRAAEIEELTEIPPVNLVGKTNLKQLAHILKNARLVIGGDTGPVHLAAGMGTRTIMLMGPTDANRNGPYGPMGHAIEVERPCRWCWKRACPKGIDCLEEISPEQVEQTILHMM